MRLSNLLALAAVGGATTAAAAQTVVRAGAAPAVYRVGETDHRAALGMTTSTSGTLRDTLGILITNLTKNGPAEKAGLEEGNRIAAINGVSLRANAADVEDNDMASALTRRLTRELGKVKAGDDIELRVYHDGKTTSMKIKTADADELFRPTYTNTSRASALEERDNRPVLGFSLGSTGSHRDTLGVLVMSVSDSTPAAKAGLEEGNRIAAINGVNLRLARDEAGDREMSSIKVQRLQREISKLKPGENVTLSVYSNGKFRDVTMKVARAADMPKNARGSYTIIGGDGFGFAPFPPMPSMPSMPAMPPMPASPSFRVMTPPAGSYQYDYAPQVRERLEAARAQIERIQPQIRMNLENIRPQVRMNLENLRPQMERLQQELRAMPARIRVTRVTV